jgi:hypothetical protein
MTTTAPRTRRTLRALSTVMIVAGVILLADAGVTLLWQEPVSAVYAHFQQDRLSDRLETLERTPLAPAARPARGRGRRGAGPSTGSPTSGAAWPSAPAPSTGGSSRVTRWAAS